MFSKVQKFNSPSFKSVFRTYAEQLLLNPFFLYASGVILSLLFYSLKWSEYPKLSLHVLLLYLGAASLSLLIGFFVTPFRSGHKQYFPGNSIWKLSLCGSIILSMGFLVLYINGGVPLFKILFSSNNYNYQEVRGVPYLSTLVMYGYSTLICIWTGIYLLSSEKRYLFLVLIGFMHVLLMASRGYAMLIVFPLVTLLLYYIKYNWKVLSCFVVATFIGLYVFGKFGDYREQAKNRDVAWSFYDEYKGKNYPKNLPKEFLWSYFYFTSPLAKFQYATEDVAINNQENNFKALLVHQFVPYSFGNRINKFTNLEERVSSYIYPPWFVGTSFYGPFLYAKWLGVIIYLILMFGYVLLIYRLARKLGGVWFLLVLANLTLFMALSLFDNMIVFAPINFQIWGLLLLGKLLTNHKPST